MSVLKKYMKLKRRVEQAQQKADKADGALEQVMKRLKTEFGVSTLSEAEKKLTVTKKQAEKLQIEFTDRVEKFEEDWGTEEEQNESY